MLIPDVSAGDQAVICTRGLPGCGKSTLAGEWVRRDPKHRVRINRDDLRAELFQAAGLLLPEREDVVTGVQRARTLAALGAGRSVILDDTFLDERHIRAWRELVEPLAVPVLVVDVPTPVDECVRRDRARGASGGRQVGEVVIRMLAARYGYTNSAA